MEISISERDHEDDSSPIGSDAVLEVIGKRMQPAPHCFPTGEATRGTLISPTALGADGTLYTASMDGNVYAFHDTKRGRPSQGPLSGTWYGTVTIRGTVAVMDCQNRTHRGTFRVAR